MMIGEVHEAKARGERHVLERLREPLLELRASLKAEALPIRAAQVKAVLGVGVHDEVVVVDQVLVTLLGLETGLLARARVLRGSLDVAPVLLENHFMSGAREGHQVTQRKTTRPSPTKVLLC